MNIKSNTVMYEVQKVQDTIEHIDHRINVLERQLMQQITIVNRESLESELRIAKKLLEKNENLLRKLCKDNSKTFMIAACLVFIIFLIFGLYSMIFNTNKL